MPKKKYKTEDEILKAKNEKAKKYYQKNSKLISEKNSIKYNSNKFYYVYKVTHPLTGQYYIGSRSCLCLPEEDINYKGSQSTWKLSKTEKQTLFKEIIKSGFKNREDCIEFEGDQIRNCIEDPLNENYYIPSKTFGHENKVTVRNESGKIILISKEDPDYINGKLKFMHCGKVTVTEGDKIIMVDVKDPRYLSGELKFIHCGKVIVFDKSGKKISISNKDPRYLSGEFISSSKNTVLVKDGNNNKIRVSKEDPRYLSGELKFIATGNVCVKDSNGNCFYVDKKDPRYLNGELCGSSKGYWGWSIKIEIDGEIKTAKDYAGIYNIKVKDLKDFLEKSGISYKRIKNEVT